MYVTAREGEPFEELYRRFKRGMEASGILREYRGSSGSSRPTRRGATRSAPPRANSAGHGRNDRPSRIDVMPQRNTPEFMTLVAVAVGLGVAIVVQVLRRRGARH